MAKISGVYLAEAPEVGMVKIGRSIDVAKRFRDLENGSPVPLRLAAVLIGGAVLAEGVLHEMFSSCRSHGEWFRVEGKLRAFLGWAAARREVDIRDAMREAYFIAEHDPGSEEKMALACALMVGT